MRLQGYQFYEIVFIIISQLPRRSLGSVSRAEPSTFLTPALCSGSGFVLGYDTWTWCLLGFEEKASNYRKKRRWKIRRASKTGLRWRETDLRTERLAFHWVVVGWNSIVYRYGLIDQLIDQQDVFNTTVLTDQQVFVEYIWPVRDRVWSPIQTTKHYLTLYVSDHHDPPRSVSGHGWRRLNAQRFFFLAEIIFF